MRAILIDPENKTVTEVEYNGDYKHIYDLIDCSCFTVVQLDEANTLFVDDEGLLSDPEFFFKWEGYDQPLANKGLILGTDEEGDSIATEMPLDEVKAKVSFLRLEVAGWADVSGTAMRYGIEMPVIGTQPIFREREDEGKNT